MMASDNFRIACAREATGEGGSKHSAGSKVENKQRSR